MQPRLHQLIVLVSDMQRSIGFYRDVVGLGARVESEWWSELEAGDVLLALHPGPKPAASAANGSDAGTLTICFEVDDIERSCADLRAKGVEVDGPRTLEGMDYPIATFADPDGMSLLLQPRR